MQQNGATFKKLHLLFLQILSFWDSWKNVNDTPTLFSPSKKYSVVPGNLNTSAFCVLFAQHVSKVIAQHTETFAII